MVGIFNSAIFNNAIFNTNDSPEPDTGWLGGTFTDPYYEVEKRREAKRLRDAEEEFIRLKQEQQEIRLQELEALKVQDKQTERQLAAIERRKQFLSYEIARIIALIEDMNKTIDNDYHIEELLLIYSACPWLTIGGKTMH